MKNKNINDLTLLCQVTNKILLASYLNVSLRSSFGVKKFDPVLIIGKRSFLIVDFEDHNELLIKIFASLHTRVNPKTDRSTFVSFCNGIWISKLRHPTIFLSREYSLYKKSLKAFKKAKASKINKRG